MLSRDELNYCCSNTPVQFRESGTCRDISQPNSQLLDDNTSDSTTMHSVRFIAIIANFWTICMIVSCPCRLLLRRREHSTHLLEHLDCQKLSWIRYDGGMTCTHMHSWHYMYMYSGASIIINHEYMWTYQMSDSNTYNSASWYFLTVSGARQQIVPCSCDIFPSIEMFCKYFKYT